MEEPIPPALVLGCNTPVGINVLSDWIEEQTGHAPNFADAGWGDGCFSLSGNGNGNSSYGHDHVNGLYGGNTTHAYGDGYGDGDGNGFINSHGYGRLYGDGYGGGNGYGDADGDGWGGGFD